MTNPKLHIIILAAGAGTRMHSDKLKVLHEVAGRTMILHVLKTAKSLNPAQITVVCGHQKEALKQALAEESVNWAEQTEQLGTGHAVQQAMSFVQKNESVLVLYGDAPLVEAEDLQTMQAEACVLTAHLDDPTGYGRIINQDGKITAIVEQKDANEDQLSIQEVNSGIIKAPAEDLSRWLQQLDNNNSQGEYYLTDVIAMAAEEGRPFEAVQAGQSDIFKGANDMAQLAELEAIYQRRMVSRLLKQGVRMPRPETVDIRGGLNCGRDVVLDKNTLFIGDNQLADGVQIGAFSVLENCDLAAGTVVEAHSMLSGVKTSGACTIGPFARLRPGTELAQGSKVGNFVEMKKARVGENSKASHLSYLGDAEIGNNVNIGAGTITCNYDGVNKFTTVIKEGAFIGSDSQLVAPVTIGEGATIGAGSTITKDAPDGQLTLSRSRQRSVADWQKPSKK
jgi:bifunctional UDP-N-acetylglucosamine pyrophosphorylase/glucosamine-1-phosphate N-acetyltransferase